MHERVRRRRAGLTVVEFAVVVVLLAVLAGVVGLAMTGTAVSFKGTLDAVALTTFRKRLTAALETSERRQSCIEQIAGCEFERGADLLQWLVRKQVVEHEAVRMLGGATGTQADEKVWMSASTPIDDNEYCLFTCPSDPGEFIRRALSDRRSDGVFMCYNQNFAFRFPEEGMVALAAGEEKARFVKYAEIDEMFSDAKEVRAIPVPGDFSFFGRYPFKGIAPK